METKAIPFNIKDFIKKSKKSIINKALLPMGYVAGLPILSISNSYLIVTIPYLRYKITGETDKTLVFPIRYTIDYVLPDKEIVGFNDLAVNAFFDKIDFNKSCGTFRHDAIKDLNKDQYNSLRDQAYALYDKLIAALLGEGNFSIEESDSLHLILSRLVEPSLIPIYTIINKDFTDKYLKSTL